MQTTPFEAFTYTPAACLFEFTYTGKLENGEPLPNFIQFDADSRTFSVETSDPQKVAEYSVKIIGTLNNG